MPKFLEDRLARGAKKAGLRGKDADAYVYGAMNNQGYMRGNKETARGRALQRKHDRDHPGRAASSASKSKAHEALEHRFPKRSGHGQH